MIVSEFERKRVGEQRPDVQLQPRGISDRDILIAHIAVVYHGLDHRIAFAALSNALRPLCCCFVGSGRRLGKRLLRNG